MKLSRRQFNLGLAGAGATLTGSLAGLDKSFAQTGQITVGTWGGDYQALQQRHIADALAAPTGLNVIYDASSEPIRRTKVMAERRLPRGGYDIVCMTRPLGYQLSQAGALLDLDEVNVPNLQYMREDLRTNFSAAHFYTGRVILYNPEIITKKPTSYRDLWNPDYAGKVGVIDLQYQNTIESAALIAGGSLTNYDPGLDKLMELKEMGVRFYATNELMAQALANGECAICIMWQARGLLWQNAGIPVEIAYPEEGIGLYLSELSAVKNARNKQGALAYINMMLDPRAQVAFAENFFYAPSVTNAELPEDLRKRVDIPESLRDQLFVPNSEYLLDVDNRLVEWWNRVFKA